MQHRDRLAKADLWEIPSNAMEAFNHDFNFPSGCDRFCAMSQNAEYFEGIVIRSQASGDSDLILRLICKEHGKISLFAGRARSSKKKFSTNLEVFDRGFFTLRKGRGSLKNLQNFRNEKSFRSLRENLNKMTLASLICETFDLLLKEEQDSFVETTEIYQLLFLGLSAIEEAHDLKGMLKSAYITIANTLAITGFFDITKCELPSSHNFLKLIAHLENCVEKELKCKPALMSLFSELQKVQAA